MSNSGKRGALSEFAANNGLEEGTGGELPRVGTVLDPARGNTVEAAVHGRLPEGPEGALVQLIYERRSDDHTITERLTAVVTRVPESIGFAPYLSYGDGSHIGLVVGQEAREIGNVRVRVDSGVDQGWLTELLSPALCDWLSRSPRGFGFELSGGVLVVLRDGLLSGESELRALCADAGRLAAAIREEVLEETDAGKAARSAAARGRDPEAVRIDKWVPHVSFERRTPKDVADALGAYQSVIRRAPFTYVDALIRGFLLALGISIISGGIYGLLLTAGDPLTNVVIWEGAVFLVCFYLALRSRINNDARAAAEQAFYLEYAKARGLRLLEPLAFAAEHAEAGLPGTPVRVLSGIFNGPENTVDGALLLTGGGMQRGESAALVAGRRGPTATVELEPSAPGISADYLDQLTATLLLDLATAPGQAPAGWAAPGH